MNVLPQRQVQTIVFGHLDAHNEDILFLHLQPNWKIPILQNNVRNGDIDNHTLASCFPLDSI